MHQAYLLELTPSEPQPIILLPMQLAGLVSLTSGGGATATADASASKVGIANATANATGGSSIFFSGGTATASANVTNGGSAVAQATGGSTAKRRCRLCCWRGSATATSSAMLGGTANATATATGGRRGNFSSPVVVEQTPTLRYDNQRQCGSGAVHCDWRSGAGPGNRTDQFRKFPIGSIYVHKPLTNGTTSTLGHSQCNRTGRWCRFSFQPDHSRAEFFGR